MTWKIKAIMQKVLALLPFGEQLNHIPARLQKNYHQNKMHYQVHESLRKFSHYNKNIPEYATALEIGTGYSIMSSICLHLLGFSKIITVDITKDLKFLDFKKQIYCLSQNSLIDDISKQSIFSKIEIVQKINKLKKVSSLQELFKLANIEYVAPYSFNLLSDKIEKIDFLCSQVVLEHIEPKELDALFVFKIKHLSIDGISVHTINFIDHFANPGLFNDKAISEFNFLKFSDKRWKFWAGNSIAYTNRLCYKYYIELCKKHNLKLISFVGENYRKQHPIALREIHSDILKKYDNPINLRDLQKYQRGTLVIKNN